MNFKKLSSLFLAGLMCLGLTACSQPAQEEGGMVCTAGTYTEEAQGYGGTITVEVTVSENAITDVKITGDQESEGIGSNAVDQLGAKMVEAQTSEVDGVSGATVSSDAIKAAAAAALAKACTDLGDGNANADNGEVTEETLDVDVVVLGAGGAGMTAAIEAANAGKTVVIVEKAGMTGGNTVRSTGGMNASETVFQQENTFEENAGVEKTIANAKENYPELAELTAVVEEQYNEFLASGTGYFDSNELFMLDTLVGGGNLNDHELVRTLVENSAAGIDWLATIGADLTSVSSFGGASVKRIHRPVDEEGKTISVGSYLVPILTKAVEDLGVEILYNTPATEILVNEDGSVAGVKASSDKTNYTINAKSVVIATGGFGANLELVAQYKPELADFVTTNAPGIVGDGIVMAQNIGADVVDMDQIQIHPTVEQTTSALITEGLRGDGAILVNAEGLRFCDEVGTRDVVSAAEIAQTGGYAYLIVDQAMVDASSVIAGYINKGLTVQGDDYAALAEAMGVPADAFTTTMETWNAAVEAKSDPEFGRTSFANPLATGPYYAIKVAPGVHHTMGGLHINTSAEVLNTEGNAIPGLFAAGEVTGGVHGNNRLGGNAVADIIVFGRIAGQSAAAYAE